MARYVCIHCHFYQPPRENPWLGAIELQDSASPYHDWNERIAAECYAPNCAARILDGQGRIARIVNNYARISFDFAPTLLSWLEEKAPRTYEAILAADRQSRELFSGHGAALALAYNHVILPLASPRDKYTQILWGMRDFQHRFRRDPEGMWLPETAVDTETLECLSSLGVKFTILAPHQAKAWRRSPWENWTACDGGSIDPSRAYQCNLPSGRTISLFFYDGPISHAVAFEKLLSNGVGFAHRLLSGFNGDRSWPQLMHIATDGETYGHHHPHGDMALAYALDYIERNHLARTTNYGEFLAQHPPKHEVAIAERTSWSCVHGVSRWETDCGCNSGMHASWNQQWRRPLRDALNWLRDCLAPFYEAEAQPLLRDPWLARDDYIRVVLDRTPWNVDAFLARHGSPGLSRTQQVRALKLLEMQRHLMLMFTSCGWFFDELSGLEAVQSLQYAGRAIQLVRELMAGAADDPEEEFLRRLEAAWSNIPGFGNGRQVYDRFVRPAMLDLPGVAAHYAISSLFDGYRGRSYVYCYSVDLLESRVLETGKARLALGRAAVCSRLTREQLTLSFGVLHFGDHNVTAGVRPSLGEDEFRDLLGQATRAFQAAELAECLRVLDRHFQGAAYSLKSLFRDEQRRIVSQIVAATLRDAESTYRQVYDQHAQLMCFLSELRMPLPDILRMTGDFVLDRAVQRALTGHEVDLEHVRSLLETASRNHIQLDVPAKQFALRERLNMLAEMWALKPWDQDLLETLAAVVSLARVLPFEVDLWKVQNAYYRLLQDISSLVPAHDLSSAWADQFARLGESLGVVVSDSAFLSLRLPEHTAATLSDGPSGRDTPAFSPGTMPLTMRL
jgi:alpha-amylase/alpha-mannosidase (GH57 family)